ncbi:MAG: hypothetical protein ACRYFR_12685 [Janthinobacterium lividum]
MTSYHRKVAALSNLPDGTIGKELANCLLIRNLTLVPGFESHDLKHVVLGYEMEPIGEIRMQAFMLGNGNWTLPSVAIFLFGMLLLPQHWQLYWQDFQLGRQCPAVATLEIDDCKDQQMVEFKKLIFGRYVEIIPAMNRNQKPLTSKLFSYFLMAVGVIAMLVCYPFLLSSNIADLVGAGFPFVAGAIFVVGGLLNLTLQSAIQLKSASSQN